jgi:hypothetical protein
MSEDEFKAQVQELLVRMRAAFAAGYGFNFPINTRSHVWIIPSKLMQPEHRFGFLLVLEGKGSLFVESPNWGTKFTLVKAGIPLATGEILARVIDGLMQPFQGPDGPTTAGIPHSEVKRLGYG